MLVRLNNPDWEALTSWPFHAGCFAKSAHLFLIEHQRVVTLVITGSSSSSFSPSSLTAVNIWQPGGFGLGLQSLVQLPSLKFTSMLFFLFYLCPSIYLSAAVCLSFGFFVIHYVLSLHGIIGTKSRNAVVKNVLLISLKFQFIALHCKLSLALQIYLVSFNWVNPYSTAHNSNTFAYSAMVNIIHLLHHILTII